MDEDKHQHLEFIQNTITRMNTNSFQIKEWCITLIAALLALYAANNNLLFLVICYFPVILFWTLDSYYLQQERKFRGIYNNVAGIDNDVEIKMYEMPIQKFTTGKYSFCSAFFSKTIIRYYLTIIILLSVLIIGIRFNSIIHYDKQNITNTEAITNTNNGEIDNE